MKKISLKTILALIKFRVSIAVTFTAITTYIVYAETVDFKILWVVLGVFLLASGASALNEYQEHKYDALMKRTQNRPIPSGDLTPLQALIISWMFIIAGAAVLYFAFNTVTALLGLFNILWYNGIYTSLKRITAFAVVPGSLVGAIPAFIGWTAAGGYVFDSTIVFISFYLFIWQVPHFWLLMLKYGSEYEQAGFPTINNAVKPQSLNKIIFTWVLGTAFSSIIIPLFLVNISLPFFLLVFVLNLSFIFLFIKLVFGKEQTINFRKSFIGINVYMMVFMIMLIAFHLI
jgi:protoheme IX farnesyltransferase